MATVMTDNKPREPRSKKLPGKYREAWILLKKRKKLTLEVEAILVPRVKKAIIKEKHKDLGFKVLNDNDYLFLDISYDPAKKHLAFKLRQRIGIEEIKS